MVFTLMLGVPVLADSVSIYEGNTTKVSRGIDFGPGGVSSKDGWDRSINPCNCNLDDSVMRNDLEKRTRWSFAAGSYTVSVPAAEPATGLFLGLGLAVFGLMRRRRKKRLENTVWEKLG